MIKEDGKRQVQVKVNELYCAVQAACPLYKWSRFIEKAIIVIATAEMPMLSDVENHIDRSKSPNAYGEE